MGKKPVYFNVLWFYGGCNPGQMFRNTTPYRRKLKQNKNFFVKGEGDFVATFVVNNTRFSCTCDDTGLL